MAKMGRPKSETPKSNKVTVRFTDVEYGRLKQCAEKNNQTVAQTIRRSVQEIIKSDS